ncbi:MAG TPA: hypothetical protein PKV66_00110 [Candidatus Pelethenecus sp.]|nr:hypothetical protein [Candidatus Pelethenecus sp.]
MTEKLYTDFTNNILPAIQEGLVITQEYFTELFSRYVKYLIITDIVTIVVVLLIAVALIVALKKIWKFSETEIEEYDRNSFRAFFSTLFGFVFIAVITPTLYFSTTNLIKAIYIPEVRVYEELKPLMK